MKATLLRCDQGNAVVEFALLAPVYLGMLIGAIYVSLVAITYVNLHFAVEAAARCAAIQKTVCVDSATTQSHAQNQFIGFGVTPAFHATVQACGNQVTGSTTLIFQAAAYSVTVPLSATACYP
ncbi:MAG: pilus assembly protein [Alphaproteobacteria bacterium]|nr:pilus assembly protein [Alphaproteobacteria bacterium]